MAYGQIMYTRLLFQLGLFLVVCMTFSSSLQKEEKRDQKESSLTQTSTTSSISVATWSTSTSSSTSTIERVKNTSTLSSSSSSSTTTTLSSTTTWPLVTEDPRCRTDASLGKVCSAISDFLIGANFWDVYNIMFSNDVIQALLLSCSSGHWCLRNKYDFWEALMIERAQMVLRSDMFSAVCESNSRRCLHEFVSNYTECKVFKEMNVTMEAVDLLCQLKNEMSPLECIEHVLAALHVTVVDILRDQNQKQFGESVSEDSCKSPESQITRTFLCLGLKCPNSTDSILKSFQPWRWFIGDVPAITNKCGFRSDVCDDDTLFKEAKKTSSTTSSSAAAPSSSSSSAHSSTAQWFDASKWFGNEPEDKNQHKDNNTDLFTYDVNMLVGVTVTSLILLSVMVISFCLWLRKQRQHRMMKAGYSPLKSDDA